MLPLPWLQHGYDSLEAFDLREQIPLNGLMPRRTDVYYNFLENLTSGKKPHSIYGNYVSEEKKAQMHSVLVSRTRQVSVVFENVV